MFKQCPGLKDLTSPQSITIRTCPKCGSEVEFFSDDLEVECSNCGRPLHREVTNACVSWCMYALECIADLKNRGLVSYSKALELESIARESNKNLKLT